MSDSEDDFMSDKFLVEAPSTSAPKSYSARRQAETLQSLRKGQANNKLSHKQQEEKNRREGLSTNLFDTASTSADTGGSAAMALMAKMGWKKGEGLGKRRSASPPLGKRKRGDGEGEGGGDGGHGEDEDEAPRGGLGSRGRARVEPIRVSLWAGRKGLSARSPSPPPLPSRNPDVLDPRRMAMLGQATDDFRSRQRRDFEEREVEKTEWKAREQLIKFDDEKGVKFHPLHVLPFDPLGTLPRPLLKLIYPASAYSPEPAPVRTRSPSPPLDAVPALPEREKLVSAAEKVREQMRKDMLSSLGGADEDSVRFGIPQAGDDKAELREDDAKVVEENKVDWREQVSGTKRVLSMSPREHLTYLLSQLRNEHMYCFWCSFKYKSFEEMDGPGGCPGEEEDDH